MFKKIVFTICVIGVSLSSMSAKEINIKDVDGLAWMTYKATRYPALLKYENRQEPMKNWYMRTYHSDVYEKVKNDQFALDDVKEKYYVELIDKMKLLKVDKVSPNNYIKGDFILNATGKIEKYDFKKKAFIINPEATDGISRTRNGRSFQYVGKPENRKLVLRSSIIISPHYLKIEKDDAKKLMKSLKDGRVLLKYKVSVINPGILNRSTMNEVGPWVDFFANFRQSKAEVINPGTNEIIGIAQSEK